MVPAPDQPASVPPSFRAGAGCAWSPVRPAYPAVRPRPTGHGTAAEPSQALTTAGDDAALQSHAAAPAAAAMAPGQPAAADGDGDGSDERNGAATRAPAAPAAAVAPGHPAVTAGVVAASSPDAGCIALLGTSADPPTHGHRALLEGLLHRYPAVATWASDNPLKQHTAALELRQALLAALVAAIGDPRLQLVQELSSPWAIETLRRAGELWPRRHPVFVVGSDLLEQIPRWRGAAQWLPGCRLAVVPRAGWPLQDGALERLRQLGARAERLDLSIPASASSGVRASADPERVPRELWPLLRRHDPYGLFPG